MPVIKQYTRQHYASGIRKEKERTAADFGGMGAEAMQSIGQGMSDVSQVMYQRAQQKEVSDLSTKLSKAQADNAIDMRDVMQSTDPGDKEALQEYQKRAQKRLEDAGADLETVGGRNYYTQQSSTMSQQVRLSVVKSQAELDGEKAVLDYNDTLNNLTSATLNDPSMIQQNTQMHHDFVDQLVATKQIPASAGAKLKQQGETDFVKSSLRGWMKLDPAFAQEKLDSGIFDKQLGGDGKMQMNGEIKQAIRAREIEMERRRKEQERIVKEQQKQTQDEFLNVMNDNGLTADKVLDSNLEPFGTGSKQQFLNMLKAKGSNKVQSNGPKARELFAQIAAPYDDPQKITDPNDLNEHYINNEISYEDLQRLRKEIDGSTTPKGRAVLQMRKRIDDIAKANIAKADPVTGVMDPDGAHLYAAYMDYVDFKVEEYRKEGKPLDELFRPGSKEYVGNKMSEFKRSMQETTESQLRRIRGDIEMSGGTKKILEEIQDLTGRGALIRKENESPAEFLERTKKAGN